MNAIVDRLGAALLHFLWQGVAIAALYAVVRRATSGPNARSSRASRWG